MNRMHPAMLAAVSLAFSNAIVSAETITVCASGCHYTSINAAIGAASDGDVIQLAAETYFEGGQIDTLGKAVTLRGSLDEAGEPASVLDGAGKHRVLVCQGGETSATVFQNLMIQNGYIAGDGGGMYNHASSPTLDDCTFADNSADRGGGMYNDSSSPTMASCVFTGNSATRGGGMFDLESTPDLFDCTFTGNAASGYGGAMYGSFSNPVLTGCTLMANSASVGGALYNEFSGPALDDCALELNSADFGGAMYNEFSNPVLTGCGFAGNLAGLGDAIYNSASSVPTLVGCIFAECCQIDRPGSIVDGGGNDYHAWCDDCRADVNCRDDAVTAADLGILIGSWGTSDPQCDIDGDGNVGAADLGLLIAAWGPCR